MSSKDILEYFGDTADPREDNKRHQLLDIVFIVVCASICGAEKWDDVEALGKSKRSWLGKLLELPHGIPSHDRFARVFAMLDPEALNRRCFSWVGAINPKYEQEIVSIDGKTIRHSYDTVGGSSAIHMVSAWASEARLTLGQRGVDEKSNEITAIPELLEMLELEGCVVTIDAMGTQTEIAKKIVSCRADYVLALKGNQSTLHEDVELFFEGVEQQQVPTEEITYRRRVDTDHGRIETCECWATGAIDWLEMKPKWKGLQSILMVRGRRTIGESQSSETRLFISSLKPDAEQLGHIVRAHWAIENSLHRVLDVAFREDEWGKRKDHSAENFAVLRHITLNLVKQEKTWKRSIAGKRLLAGWDESYVEKILSKS